MYASEVVCCSPRPLYLAGNDDHKYLVIVNTVPCRYYCQGTGHWHWKITKMRRRGYSLDEIHLRCGIGVRDLYIDFHEPWEYAVLPALSMHRGRKGRKMVPKQAAALHGRLCRIQMK